MNGLASWGDVILSYVIAPPWGAFRSPAGFQGKNSNPNVAVGDCIAALVSAGTGVGLDKVPLVWNLLLTWNASSAEYFCIPAWTYYKLLSQPGAVINSPVADLFNDHFNMGNNISFVIAPTPYKLFVTTGSGPSPEDAFDAAIFNVSFEPRAVIRWTFMNYNTDAGVFQCTMVYAQSMEDLTFVPSIP